MGVKGLRAHRSLYYFSKRSEKKHKRMNMVWGGED